MPNLQDYQGDPSYQEFFIFCGRFLCSRKVLTLWLTTGLNGVRMVKVFCGLRSLLVEVVLFLMGLVYLLFIMVGSLVFVLVCSLL